MLNMKTILTASFLTLLSSATFASSIEDITRGTFVLYADGTSICTTQLVSPDLLLTANHCVEKPDVKYSIKKVNKNDNGGIISEEIFYAVPTEQSTNNDTAILELFTPFYAPVVDVATDEEAATLKLGDPVLLFGYPGSTYSPQETLVVTDGLYTGITNALVPTITGKFIRTTAGSYYGKSGGGLYAEFDGEWKLIGSNSQLNPEIISEFSLATSTEAVNEIIVKASTTK